MTPPTMHPLDPLDPHSLDLPPEFSILGFDFPDFSELMLTVLDSGLGQPASLPTGGGALIYQDPSGARFTALDEGGWCGVLGFSVLVSTPARLYRPAPHLAMVELPAPSGQPVVPIACASDEFFALPASIPSGTERVEVSELELTAVAASAQVLTRPSNSADGESGSLEAGGPSEPGGRIFSETAASYYQDFNPRNLKPYAEIEGRVLGVETRMNQLGEAAFRVCTLKVSHGLCTLILPGDAAIAVDDYVHSRAFMMAGVGYWAKNF